MEPLRRGASARRLVAVFDKEADARAAAAALRDAGIDVDHDTASDELAAIRGEMSEEMQHTIVGPGNIGPFTKEMTRGILVGVVIATVVGALIGSAFGLIGALVGAAGGAVIGFLVGGAFRWQASVGGDAVTKRLAAERGATVGVWANSDPEVERAAELLTDFDPIRLDRVTPEGHPLRTVTTEDESSE